MPSLQVTVASVSGLPKKSGLMDKTDSFVEIQMGSASARTATQNNAGESALFDQVLTFPYHNEPTMVVYAKDDDGKPKKDDYLGMAQVTLPPLLAHGQWNGTIALVPFKGLEAKMNNPAVTLHMRVIH